MKRVQKTKSVVWICVLCLLMSGVFVLCTKRDDDKEQPIKQSTESTELPEDNLKDDEVVNDKNNANTDTKDKTTQTQNSSDTSKENTQEDSKVNSEESSKEETEENSKEEIGESSSRNPIVLPPIRLD